MRLDDDACLIVETKGQEDLDVALKDRRAQRWCQDATRLSDRDWTYEKVPQKLFDGFDGDTVEGLRRFLDASGASGKVRSLAEGRRLRTFLATGTYRDELAEARWVA